MYKMFILLLFDVIEKNIYGVLCVCVVCVRPLVHVQEPLTYHANTRASALAPFGMATKHTHSEYIYIGFGALLFTYKHIKVLT